MTTTLAHVNVAKGYRGGERQTELLVRELNGLDFEQVLVARRNAPLSRRFDDIDLEIRQVSGNPFSVARACAGVDLILPDRPREGAVIGDPVVWDGYRTPLPTNVLPGQSITVEQTVLAPEASGHYTLVLDPVRERVVWFSDKNGQATFATEIEVLPKADTATSSGS